MHFDIDSRRVLSEGVIGLVPCVGEFSPDGRRFVVGGTFGEVRVLDVEAGEWVGPARRGHDGEVCGVRYAPDGAMFATGAADGAIVLWDGITGAEMNRLPATPSGGSPNFLPDGHTVLITSLWGPVHMGHQA